MSIHDELLTLMAKPTTDEEWLNIDWESRLITIPSTLTNIGVYNDKDTNRLYFRCPIEYGEFKIADFGVHVNYQNTGKSNTKYDGDVYFVDDVESDGEYLTFSWLVGRHAYLEQGTTAFIVCCKVVDGDDNVVNELNTTIATLSVLEGLEVDVLPPEDYPDYLEEILKRCEAAEETAQEAKDAVQSAQDTADEALTKANSAITGVTVNGESQPVNDNIAELTIAAGVTYCTCDSDADEEYKDIGATVRSAPDGFVLAVLFTKGNTLEEILIGGDHLSERPTIGDARCPENSTVFFVYSTEQSAFIVDAGLTRANEVADSAITAITVNGEDVPVEDNKAEITVSGAEPTVEDETLIF